MDTPEITESLLGLYEDYGHLATKNMRIFLKWAGIDRWSKESCILDIGCATGLLLNELKSKGFTDLVGIDSSPEMVKRAQQHTNAKIFLGNAEEVDRVLMGQADIVISSNIIHHIELKEDWDKMLIACNKSLRPNGLLILREPNQGLVNTILRPLSKYKIFRFNFLKPIMEAYQSEWKIQSYFYKYWYPAEVARINRCGFEIEGKRDWLFHRFYKLRKVS